MSTTLPLFWHLSSANKKERIDASVKLVGALEHFQSQFVPRQSSPDAQSHSEGEEEDEDAGQKTKDDELDTLNAQDVSYSIRRLIRGLASPRESSRLGFAVALTELLSRINTVTCTYIVTLILDSSKPQGSMTGQEERDVLFARLFGLMSVIQSNLLVRQGSLPSSSAEISNLSSYTEVLSQLISLGEKKSWLRESAWYTILQAIDVLHNSDVSWKDEAAETIVEQLFVEYKIWCPEKIAAGLKLQSLYPNKAWNKLFAPPFKNADLLSSTNLHTLAGILKEPGIEETGKDIVKTGGGPWKPQLHFVWDYLLEHFLPGPDSKKTIKGSFQDFFRVVVDETLFSTTSSPQRKYWGFQVFQKALHRISEENMSLLFTKNFMRSWINHLSNRDRYLHKIAQQTATEVQSFVQKNPQLGFSLILQLTGVYGSHQFDRLTKTKTIETILTSTDGNGVQKYIRWLFSQVDEPEATDNDAIHAVNARRQWIIDQLGALIRNSGIPKNDEWVQSILDWLVVNGLFLVKKKSSKTPIAAAQTIPKLPFSDELRKGCRLRLLSCLSDLSNQSVTVKINDKSMKAAAVASDGEFWVSKVLSTISHLESNSKHISLLSEADEEDQLLRTQAKEVVRSLKSVSQDRMEAARGAELLLLATILQHYCSDDDAELDNESLEACIEGTRKMFPDKKKEKNKKEKKDRDEDSVEPIDVLVDTIIGFLEKSTSYLRTVGNQAFALLSGSVKESTVDLIITQLERRDPTVRDEDEDAEMKDDEEDDVIGESEGDDGGVSTGEDESEDEEEEEEEEEGNDEEVQALRSKIEEALRVNGIEPATGETDSEEEEEEELMDDEQMLAIDEQLAAVFRSRTSDKKSAKIDAQREATHFKNRVLDLVDTFVKKQPSNLLVLRLIVPLIELMTGTGPDERQLLDKAKGILRSRIAKLKEIPSDVTQDHVIRVFEDTHNHARHSRATDLLPTLSQCSLYLSRILHHLNADDVVARTYRESLNDFLTRKNSALNSIFFQEFLRRYPSIGWQLRADLLKLSSKAVNGYRQVQAFQLMETLINQAPLLDDRETKLVTLAPPVIERVLETAIAACAEQATVTAVQLKEVMKVAVVTLRQTQRFAPNQLQQIWNPDPWISLHSAFANSTRFGASVNLQKICEQISHTVQQAESEKPHKPKKRKVIETESIPDGKKAKKKKVKEDN